ncbi:type II toxin-antitoxin system Phd/YefM family antitoxin [Pseudomonas sp. PDM19]|uniref:type II toxin-antitoxin system Phd/YefM family antitoxin n=1 Tax=Pseudomonas sp. PDM19 TaxID=2769272 RepID=UPI0017874E28|nr:type II toxin-antitoxin system prevent-host-death family antitoxin [Pseudomonas sp. PDM19]MBD9628748.1 type II toxin-antitoxin system prevent-host-death family antitoxin [Pseudomonas sp. PDM19]
MQTPDVHNIHDAKSNLSKLVDQAAKGEVVIIGKAGKPVAKLVSLTYGEGQRKPFIGSLKGRLSDEFDALDDEIAQLYLEEPSD